MKGILTLCWWECKSGAPTMENSIEVFFKKLEIELPYDPTVPILGIYRKKKMKTKFEKIHLPQSS